MSIDTIGRVGTITNIAYSAYYTLLGVTNTYRSTAT